MKQAELDRLLGKVTAQARALGIPVSPNLDPHVHLNYRAKNRFGCCIRQDGRYTIELAARMLDAKERSVLRVLAHEVLHACRGCSNHGPRWQGYAARMNAAYGYGVRRADNFASLGLVDDRPVRYWVVCTRCGARTPRMKRSPLVDHPERYRCKCGGKLRVEPAGGQNDFGKVERS